MEKLGPLLRITALESGRTTLSHKDKWTLSEEEGTFGARDLRNLYYFF